MDALFIDACLKGDIGEAKRIYESDTCIDTRDHGNAVFVDTCRFGQLEVAKWLMTLGAIKPLSLNDAFMSACDNGHLEVAKWLVLISGTDDKNGSMAFVYACESNHPDVAKWLMTVDSRIQPCSDAFSSACGNGHLEIAKWLSEFECMVPDAYAFSNACANGYIDIAKWVQPLIGSVSCFEAFMYACGNGHLEVAKWVSTLEPMTGNHKADAFVEACRSGHLEVSKWLLGPDLDNDCFGISLIHACSNGRVDTVKWLITFKEVYSHHVYDLAFVTTCKTGNLEMAKFLKATIRDHVFNLHWAMVKTCNNGHLDVVKWLSAYERFDCSLINACKEGYFDVIEWAIGRYAVAGTENLLTIACNKGFLDIAKLLYSKGTPIDRPVELFAEACLYGNLETMQWLMSVFDDDMRGKALLETLDRICDPHPLITRHYKKELIWLLETFPVVYEGVKYRPSSELYSVFCDRSTAAPRGIRTFLANKRQTCLVTASLFLREMVSLPVELCLKVAWAAYGTGDILPIETTEIEFNRFLHHHHLISPAVSSSSPVVSSSSPVASSSSSSGIL